MSSDSEQDTDPPERPDDVAFSPGDAADPDDVVRRKIPDDVLAKYDVFSYRNAAVILSETRAVEFNEILQSLRQFSITKETIRRAGGNESDIPKMFSRSLRPQGWYETTIQGDLVVNLRWREQVAGRGATVLNQRQIVREKYLDGHKIDYVKNRVAFDLEWNSKDQTFDRDLYAFNAFSQCGIIDAAVLVTRSASLNRVFAALGPALNKNGQEEMKANGTPRMTREKYGASTTWMGKLLYRLNAGRNGGCPVLAIGITPACISDWS
jgi:hypothetical protein